MTKVYMEFFYTTVSRIVHLLQAFMKIFYSGTEIFYAWLQYLC